MTNVLRDDALYSPRNRVSHRLLRVVRVDPQTDKRYEAFVESQPSALIYHHPAWLQVLSRENGGEPVCLACEDDEGRLTGVLPLFPTRGLPFARGPLTGRRLSSLPRTSVAGPLACDSAASAALIRAAVELTSERPGTQLQIKQGTDDLNGIVEGLAGVPWRPYYQLELPDRIEDLRFGSARNHTRIRSTVINKAETLNLRVREADSERDLRAWYETYLETMRWHATPPLSGRFFKGTWDLLRPRGFFRLLLAEIEGTGQNKLLAGSIFLMFGRTCFYAFNGCRRSALSLQPNDVIQWHAIHTACMEGFRYYDLGEVPRNQHGLSFFKRKWGAQEKWLYRYYYPASRHCESGGFEKQASPLAKAIWRMVPLKATMLLGDCIYRYV